MRYEIASLAQLVERFIYTEDVAGSSPAGRTASSFTAFRTSQCKHYQKSPYGDFCRKPMTKNPVTSAEPEKMGPWERRPSCR